MAKIITQQSISMVFNAKSGGTETGTSGVSVLDPLLHSVATLSSLAASTAVMECIKHATFFA